MGRNKKLFSIRDSLYKHQTKLINTKKNCSWFNHCIRQHHSTMCIQFTQPYPTRVYKINSYKNIENPKHRKKPVSWNEIKAALPPSLATSSNKLFLKKSAKMALLSARSGLPGHLDPWDSDQAVRATVVHRGKQTDQPHRLLIPSQSHTIHYTGLWQNPAKNVSLQSYCCLLSQTHRQTVTLTGTQLALPGN